MLRGKSILLVITGGIAACKAPDLIRLIRKSGAQVRCILTRGGEKFITPLSIAALSENTVYTDLFSLKDETEMGHIRLSRACDLIVVAPASADFLARLSQGRANDLAAATLLAADKPVMVCPAMNPMMWMNKATQENIRTLTRRDILFCGPEEGETACGETGYGRMSEPRDILDAVLTYFQKDKPLAGRTALVTSGPTYEPIDPVRFIGNRSSGKQGHAIAKALAEAGAAVTLVSGPTALSDPEYIKTVRIETASEMLETCEKLLPADIFVSAAAVADWTLSNPAVSKIKKGKKTSPPVLNLTENTDILARLSEPNPQRPKLVIGFAAETENLLQNARAKRDAKGCDWIVANEISGQNENVFGSEENHAYLITEKDIVEWPKSSKDNIAKKLVQHIARFFDKTNTENPQQEAAE
ncbi:MAG: bifunctional phosphopantothenoylcysteine decarboxylase/phosphopantothenate--cysteine ligase CoaBC [Rhodospirillales bacterium]|nr:bifunctional phosphopantothenoylcysteine decarboxylase/phosphopantothenate--cysteine ligase CoaBC [Alphaproteobacteria bacterium]USO03537.1 MAG: bifunctional phosphopantothenoylcysteine decarboxylase/phosphopantothenate--cysteine ligase CoaBC [Rhodospirillales bacterium]